MQHMLNDILANKVLESGSAIQLIQSIEDDLIFNTYWICIF